MRVWLVPTLLIAMVLTSFGCRDLHTDRAEDLKRLRVDSSGRFLVDADGEPFFLLGDTGWGLFHKLDREQVEVYLEDRRARAHLNRSSWRWAAARSRYQSQTLSQGEASHFNGSAESDKDRL